jgi:hypothetical protein
MEATIVRVAPAIHKNLLIAGILFRFVPHYHKRGASSFLEDQYSTAFKLCLCVSQIVGP